MLLVVLFSLGALAADAPRVLLLREAPLHADLDGPAAGVLPEGLTGRALATGLSMRPSPWGEYLQQPMVLVEAGGSRGWVHGHAVAIEQSWDGPGWWEGESMSRRVGGRQLWTAGWTGAEHDAEDELAQERRVHEGWLVVQEGDVVHRLPWSISNGWGTSRGAEEVVWRDVTGDGEDDAFVVFAERVTEAGSAGRILEIWDFTAAELVPLLQVRVDDPHWNGLATQDAHGWIDVFVEEQRMVKTAVRTGPCAEEATPLGTCTWVEEQVWSWPEGNLRTAGVQRAPLQAFLFAGALHDAPWPEVDATRGRVQGEVCVDRVSGPIGIGDRFWARVASCEDGSLEGWVPSERLSFGHPVAAEILGLWPHETGPYVRFDWDR